MVRVLALHGKSQNKEVFRTRLGQLPKKTKKFGVVFQIIEAPHDLPLEDGDSVAMKSWFDRIEFKSVEPESLEKTLRLVETEWRQAAMEGDPFVGIFGFSQGGTLTGIISSQPDRFPGLKFVVVVGAPNNDIVDAAKIPRHLNSLHCAGETDTVVPIDSSRALALKFNNPEFYIHEQGHCIPSRAASQKKIVQYFETMVTTLQGDMTFEESVPAIAPTVRSEAALEGQREEIEALLGIYEDLVEPHFVPAAVGDDTLSLTVRLSSPELLPALEKQIGVRFCMSPLYPEEGAEPPQISLDVGASLSLKDFPSKLKATLLHTLRTTAAEYTAMQSQCAFACIQAGIECLCDPPSGLNSTPGSGLEEDLHQRPQGKGGCVDGEVHAVTNQDQTEWYLQGRDPLEMTEEEEAAEVEMMEEATRHAAAAQARRLSSRGGPSGGEETTEEAEDDDSGDESSGGGALGSRGVWRYCIGLVGKPSAGKSTLYNCATRAALNRAGRHEAAVAAQPFTTIDPNVSDGFFLGPEEGEGPKKPSTFSYGADEHTGRRLLPVRIKDVAGLVPGAYKGRGKGNRFLNDLTEADCLVHVVDCSGLSDASGHLHHRAEDGGAAGEGGSGEEGGHATDTDAKWIRQELHRWIFHNVKAKWDSVVRRVNSARAGGTPTMAVGSSGGIGHKKAIARVISLFTGYKGTSATLLAALKDAGLDEEKASEYTEREVHLLVAHFLQRRFPICLALNKVDLVAPSKLQLHIQSCRASAHQRGELAVPVCAEAECQAIKELAAKQQHGGGNDSSGGGSAEAKLQRMAAAVEALGGCGSAVGVLACLTAAVSMRAPVYVYPVSDLDTLAPVAWKPGEAEAGDKDCPPCLQDCILAKPGSTVGHIFSALKGGALPRARLNGEFVRCSAIPHPHSSTLSSIKSDRRVVQLGKDSTLREKCIIVHIQANRKSVWQ